MTKPKLLGGLGLKKSFTRNKSLLAKLAWAVHTNENTTWADTLRKKYLTSNTAKRKSTIWNSIQKSEPICKLVADSKWPIRQFLQDNWTRHGPLRILIQGSLHVSDLHLKVKDTRDANGNWDFSTLFFVLPSHLQDIIHATPKPFHSPSMISFLGIPLRMAASTFIQLIYSPPYSPKLPMLSGGFRNFSQGVP